MVNWVSFWSKEIYLGNIQGTGQGREVVIIRSMKYCWQVLTHWINHKFRQNVEARGPPRQHLKALISCGQRAEGQRVKYLITRVKEKIEFSTPTSLLLQDNRPDGDLSGLDILQNISMILYRWHHVNEMSWIKGASKLNSDVLSHLVASNTLGLPL